MKPDWKDAPKWARWLAMDGDGGWYWHERRPTMQASQFCDCPYWESQGRSQFSGAETPSALPLEPKPRKKDRKWDREAPP